MKQISNKKGFTLIELMVTFALAALFMVTVVGVVTLAFKAHRETLLINRIYDEVEVLSDKIYRELTYAQPAEGEEAIIIENGTIKYRNNGEVPAEMKLDAGKLVIVYDTGVEGEEPVSWFYGAEFYRNNQIESLTFTSDKKLNNKFTVEMRVKNAEIDFSYTKTIYIQLMDAEVELAAP